MAYRIRSLVLFHLLVILPFLHQTATKTIDTEICNKASCGRHEPQIQFPFGFTRGATDQNPRCSYPNFDHLSCNNQSQTILTLPHSGDFLVEEINYELQTIRIRDPGNCFPARFLMNHILTGLPFYFDDGQYNLVNLTFLNCPTNLTDSYPLPPISCLTNSSSNYAVIAIWSGRIVLPSWASVCQMLYWAMFPISNAAMWPFWPDLNSDLELTWVDPGCGDCQGRGGVCGFANKTGLQVACFNLPSQHNGLSSTAKYGIAMGVGIPGLLCLTGLACFISGRVKTYAWRRRPGVEFSTSVVPQPVAVTIGLDGPTIEKFPKTSLGESRRLPRPSDNTCPICLSEYRPKEMLRTLPDCGHYFHVSCIDEWLRLNATCPLCRNFPEGKPSCI